jgi:hypothetical protein
LRELANRIDKESKMKRESDTATINSNIKKIKELEYEVETSNLENEKLKKDIEDMNE